MVPRTDTSRKMHESLFQRELKVVLHTRDHLRIQYSSSSADFVQVWVTVAPRISRNFMRRQSS